MEIIETTALITINETLWVQMIAFLLFLFVINRLMFRPVRRNILEREAHFDTLRENIAALEQKMAALCDQTEAEENQLKTAAHRIAEDLRAKGHEEARQLAGDAIGEIGTLRQEAEYHLLAVISAARLQVEAESNALARTIIAHIKAPEGPS